MNGYMRDGPDSKKRELGAKMVNITEMLLLAALLGISVRRKLPKFGLPKGKRPRLENKN